MADLSITLDPTSLAALVARLGRVATVETLRAPMTRGVALIHSTLATYPPPSHKKQPAKSRKQQIKQIMLARSGAIPYRRTGDLGRSWVSEVSVSEGGVEGTLGNAVRSRTDGRAYGPIVEGGDGQQAEYHRGNWPTTDSAMALHEKDIIEDFALAIQRALEI